MGSELSSELQEDLMQSSVMCKAVLDEDASPQLKKNIALLKNEIQRKPSPTTFYD